MKKKCPRCKNIYIANRINFKLEKRNKDGLTYICRYCRRKEDIIYSRKYREKNKEWKKEDNKNRRVKTNYYIKKVWAKKNPDKMRAIIFLNCAVKSGKVKRGNCVIGDRKCFGKIDGHHIDYQKPLDVIWICHKHHKQIHAGIIKLNKGRY